MIHRLLVLALAPLVCAGALMAQSDPLSTAVRRDYNRVKGYLLAAAEKMPEEHYSFQATSEVRNFGQIVAHVADSQLRGCSGFNGEQKRGDAGSLTAKADLVAALKASFDECDKAYDSITDAAAAEMVAGRRGERPKLGILYGNVAHDNELYGVLGVYLRLKGIVPPSTAMRTRR